MDYGITNAGGKPSDKEVYRILDLAWENGVRRFDTAPGYGSESLLGKFILANGIQNEAIVMTKIPSLEGTSDFQLYIKSNLELSLKHLCCPVDVLFFHVPKDSIWLIKKPQFFKNLLHEYPISQLGVSVYEPQEVERLSNCFFELSFQFPFNVLDRRFEKISMPHGRRYARSIFLQGLLASKELRSDAPEELHCLQKEYHDILINHNLEPLGLALSCAEKSDYVDFFTIGVNSNKQLINILNVDSYNQMDIALFDKHMETVNKKLLDPRNWSLK